MRAPAHNPGPEVASRLHAVLKKTDPERLIHAEECVDNLSRRVGWSASDQAALREGHIFYQLTFVDPLMDMVRGGPRDSPGEREAIEAFQLTALMVWRMLDTLLDGDPLLRNAHRHSDLAHAGLTQLRSIAQELGIVWEGAIQRQFHEFARLPVHHAPPADTTPNDLLDFLIQEHFECDTPHRGSFLLVLPNALGLPEARLTFYTYYLGLVTLDDDLDDLFSDRLTGRSTALVRYFERSGLFESGQAIRCTRIHATFRRYAINQFRATQELAARFSPMAALLLDSLATAAEAK